MEGQADVGEEFATPTHEEESATEEVTGGPHATRVDVSHGKGAALEQHGDLVCVDLVVLGFPAVDGFHVERMAQDEGDVLLGAEIREPVPAKDALGADDEIVAIGLDRAQEEFGSTAYIAVQYDLTRVVVEDAQVHGPRVKVGTAVVSVLAGVESHGFPPGLDELVRALIVPSDYRKVQEGPASGSKGFPAPAAFGELCPNRPNAAGQSVAQGKSGRVWSL